MIQLLRVSQVEQKGLILPGKRQTRSSVYRKEIVSWETIYPDVSRIHLLNGEQHQHRRQDGFSAPNVDSCSRQGIDIGRFTTNAWILGLSLETENPLRVYHHRTRTSEESAVLIYNPEIHLASMIDLSFPLIIYGGSWGFGACDSSSHTGNNKTPHGLSSNYFS